jgi:hypothetical protein
LARICYKMLWKTSSILRIQSVYRGHRGRVAAVELPLSALFPRCVFVTICAGGAVPFPSSQAGAFESSRHSSAAKD